MSEGNRTFSYITYHRTIDIRWKKVADSRFFCCRSETWAGENLYDIFACECGGRGLKLLDAKKNVFLSKFQIHNNSWRYMVPFTVLGSTDNVHVPCAMHFNDDEQDAVVSMKKKRIHIPVITITFKWLWPKSEQGRNSYASLSMHCRFKDNTRTSAKWFANGEQMCEKLAQQNRTTQWCHLACSSMHYIIHAPVERRHIQFNGDFCIGMSPTDGILVHFMRSRQCIFITSLEWVESFRFMYIINIGESTW